MKTVNKDIEVIAYFSANKEPIPLKFKLDDKSVAVDKIISKEKQKRAGEDMFVFECQSEINGEIKRYVLKYVVSKCKWYLFKI